MDKFYCLTKHVFTVTLNDEEFDFIKTQMIDAGIIDEDETPEQVVSAAIDNGYLDPDGDGDVYTEVYT